ncbi:FAD-dependent oxidoreductase [Verrucomicrobiaceae bacterium N1E253]|uniref:FAD-dependent oxidoreductase n=1 Tax=Oceaniferula marina TaxID=2748318 RepID=A0A851GDU0_9BACT|nr:FAD-dependent oxidoreductase [Oceaniferula marina]NWK55586.1 FAD-dependent oxidoreductase [Oceaniferula marina]
MQRRNFLKLFGATSLAPASVLAANSSRHPDDILVDAVSFENKGGWLVDPQFIEQMGSPYLLAHGMGQPVDNANTTITAKSDGNYNLWVRTKNWCPGSWEAPGRFQIKINGKLQSTVFGTEAGWTWQKGAVVALKKGTHTLELVDLTGFEGRCDAIYLTKDTSIQPPNDIKQLAVWRQHQHGLSSDVDNTHDFDLVIVGGGIAGCGAALAADELGLKVALIQNRPVLGGNASKEIRVHTIGIHGKVARLLKKIDTKRWHNNSPDAIKDDAKRHASLEAAKNVTLFMDYSVTDVAKDGKSISSVTARSNTSHQRIRVKGRQFIDSSGDGIVGFKAGASFRYGRESKDEFNEGWDKFGDLWSPEKEDNRVMGTTVMWRSTKGKKASKFPATPWAKDVAKTYAEKKSEWYWEYSDNDKHQIHDAEAIRDHMFRAVYGNFSNVKKNPANAQLALEWVAFIGGKRESRRIMGDHIYTMKDVTSLTNFPDTVAMEKRDIDMHYQKSLKGFIVDFISKALFMKLKGHYYIPFRSLYSKDIPNLMMAGRCFSCSHIGLGGPRVMLTCGQMGVATGYAAALCKKHNTSPRGIAKNHIKELRQLIGFE